MKYEFPVLFNARKIVPAVDELFASVESFFPPHIGAHIESKIPLMTLTVTAEFQSIAPEMLERYRADAEKVLRDAYPDYDVTLGAPEIKD